jgi:hypothetical protein
VTLYYAEKDRADKLDGLRQVANDASRPPSFDIGFEYRAFDIDGPHYGLTRHALLRIWIENLENRPIEGCRVVIENFGPVSPIRKGAMLFRDIRGEDEKSTQFHLAATEKMFFRFVEVESISFGRDDGYNLKIRCDEEGTGTFSFIDRPVLESKKQYFATIVVHGKNANSRRLDLTIDAMSETELKVTRSDSTPATERETV